MQDGAKQRTDLCFAPLFLSGREDIRACGPGSSSRLLYRLSDRYLRTVKAWWRKN